MCYRVPDDAYLGSSNPADDDLGSVHARWALENDLLHPSRDLSKNMVRFDQSTGIVMIYLVILIPEERDRVFRVALQMFQVHYTIELGNGFKQTALHDRKMFGDIFRRKLSQGYAFDRSVRTD